MWTTSLRSVLPLSSFFFLSLAAYPQSLPSDQERLLAAARLWVTGAYFDPLVATGQVDWDAQMIAALPAIRAAKTVSGYQAALLPLLKAFPEAFNGGPQRRWMHYDLEHSAFVVQSGELAPRDLNMGGGVVLHLHLADRASSPAAPSPQSVDENSTASYPPTELRILAAFKLWGAMHYFFAYRDLMDADWDDEFPKFLQQFIDAKDAREYHLAVAQAVTKLDDSNTEARSTVLDDFFGVAGVPFRLRLIDKKPLVTEVFDEASGIQAGDIVLRVDGEEIVERINREAAYLPASSHQALSELVSERLLNGAPDTVAALTVRHHDGSESEMQVKRSVQHWQDHAAVVRQLSSTVGYIDLTRLQTSEIDGAFAAVAGKAALILDARGPMALDPHAIAAKLNSKRDVAGAIISGAIVLTPDLPDEKYLTYTHSFFSVETVPVQPASFGGQLVMLIDGRTINEAELLGLFLEAARKVVFVGSDSAGACSKLSHMMLPGGIELQFSSTDVRHGNSGKLQRVGLTPLQVASPELSDIRAGRDVVLEKAVEYFAEHP